MNDRNSKTGDSKNLSGDNRGSGSTKMGVTKMISDGKSSFLIKNDDLNDDDGPSRIRVLRSRTLMKKE